VSGQLPERPELRISDADRDRAVQRLHEAVAEGRLTMTEFEERVDRVLQARTASELQPHLADLPVPAATPTAPEHQELRNTMSTIKRTGRWLVPRRLMVHNKAGTVKLDLTDAVVTHPVCEVTVESYAGTTVLVLPRGASVDIEQIERDMVASTAKVRRVPMSAVPTGQPHVVVGGKQRAATLVVRYQRRFLRWRW
jgi:hypothetical protein